MKRFASFALTAIILLQCHSCREQGHPDTWIVPVVTKGLLDPSVTYQEMIGFGGSLTWYSDRIISSPNKNKICQLLFEDLGADVIRFKNNYYPLGYPTVKTTDIMENSSIKTLFTVTNDLCDIAKQYSPGILTMVSSWSPPTALKSNGKLREGTLKRENGAFMYEAFGEYWNDVLDHLSFKPDYISIQNEPGWVTPDLETCEWRPTERADIAGYTEAFDAVYNKIRKRADPPAMIGPEAENIGMCSNLGGNTFALFSDPLKNKPYLAAYAYHTYNYPASALIPSTKDGLNMIRDSYGNKPCIMTEYSNFTWMKTALFIIQNINEANASGYLYGLMAGHEDNENAMMKLSNSGAYTLTPFYYVMKHFAKNIDKGYRHIRTIPGIGDMQMSAFADRSGKKFTVVVVNPNNYDSIYEFEVLGKVIKSTYAVQSDESSWYKELGPFTPNDRYITLKRLSVTTVVLEI